MQDGKTCVRTQESKRVLAMWSKENIKQATDLAQLRLEQRYQYLYDNSYELSDNHPLEKSDYEFYLQVNDPRMTQEAREQNFCSACWLTSNADAPRRMYCANCGRLKDDIYGFCIECSAKLNICRECGAELKQYTLKEKQ